MNKFYMKDFLYLQMGSTRKKKLNQIAIMDFKEGKNNFVFKIVFYMYRQSQD